MFQAITTEIYKDNLVLIQSNEKQLFRKSGLFLDEILDFLFELKQEKTIFVCYAFSRDNEFIFRDLPSKLKDKLFQNFIVKRELLKLETEQQAILQDYYKFDKDTQDFELADFERYVNHLALQELTEVEYKDYNIKLANGKKLVISKGRKQFVLFDLYGFFKPSSLRKTALTWLNQDLPTLDRTNFETMPLMESGELEALRSRARLEVNVIKRLAIKLDNTLQQNGIKLKSFHGATAITTHFLGKFKAKKEFHNYKNKFQLAPELHKAVHQSFFGGRIEQLKIGTLKNVKTYDINSAYATAAQFLPIFLRKPYFTQEYDFNAPFALWYCEFDLPKNLHFGLLPHRTKKGFIKYALQGKGYYFAPEVQYIVSNFPNCIEIKQGFVLPYEQAEFAKKIPEIHTLRQKLELEKNPLAKIVKLALASFYGKFCQHNGRSFYYNLFYAGFITSFVRRYLLEATKGHEHETICFLTDAIHTTANLNVSVSNKLGDFKQSNYDKVNYLDAGIYRTWNNGEVTKEKKQGFRDFNFEKGFRDFSNNYQFNVLAEFFVGHNLFSQHLFELEYLKHTSVIKTNKPLETVARIFESKDVNLKESYLDSKPLAFTVGESSLYKPSDFLDADLSLDTIEARRL